MGLLTHDGLPARKNKDGTHSTELSITVMHPALNGGRPTNIPSLWGGEETDEETAILRALASGKTFQSFKTVQDAVNAAKARSAAGGAGLLSPVNQPSLLNPALIEQLLMRGR